jgi:hypothetical protein
MQPLSGVLPVAQNWELTDREERSKKFRFAPREKTDSGYPAIHSAAWGSNTPPHPAACESICRLGRASFEPRSIAFQQSRKNLKT